MVTFEVHLPRMGLTTPGIGLVCVEVVLHLPFKYVILGHLMHTTSSSELSSMFWLPTQVYPCGTGLITLSTELCGVCSERFWVYHINIFL